MQTGAKSLPGGRAVRGPKRHRDQRTETRHFRWYVAAVSVIFALLIGVGLYFGRALLDDASSSSGTKIVSHTPPGHYMRRLEDGRTCRVTVFDHDRGEAIEDKITHCEEMPISRVEQRPKSFSWGGQ